MRMLVLGSGRERALRRTNLHQCVVQTTRLKITLAFASAACTRRRGRAQSALHCVSLHNSDDYTGMMSGGEGEQAAGAERVRELIQFELKIGSKIGSLGG